MFFDDLAQPDAQPVSLRVPLTKLPYLRAGTIWRNQMESDFQVPEVVNLEVDMGRFDAKRHAARDPHELIRAKTYRVGTSAERCYCRVFPLTDGTEIVVPTWEILRMVYFYHPRLIPALIGGAIEHPEAMSPKILPWRPADTRWLSDGVAQIGYAQFISEKLALRMARLLFDPELRTGARFIHHHIRTHRLRGQASIYIPPVSLPFSGIGKMVARVVPLPTVEGVPARQLVLSIHRLEFPLPYDQVSLVPAVDNRSTEDRDQASGVIHRPRASVVMPVDDAVSLYGSAGDSRLEGIEVAGLDDEDNATEVEILRRAKMSQTHRSSGISHQGTVEVDSVALDGSGIPVDGRPELASRSGGSPQDSNTLPPINMRLVFQALIERLQQDPEMSGWNVGPYRHGGTLRPTNIETGKKRAFYVIEISNGYRNLYVLEAKHVAERESFSVLICQLPNGKPLELDVITKWLLGFPYPYGTRWLDSTEEGLPLLAKTCIHQPRGRAKSAEDIREAFVARLRTRILKFIDDPFAD